MTNTKDRFESYAFAQIAIHDEYITVIAFRGGKCVEKITLPREELQDKADDLRKKGFAIAFADVF